jgi:uncharacterized protein
MSSQNSTSVVNWRLLILTILCITALFAVGLKQVRIDFDILNSLPTNDPVVSDAIYVLTHHPFQDRIVIDISSEKGNLDQLVKTAGKVESRLQKSSLFSQVGVSKTRDLFPGLISHITEHLPILFDEVELENRVKPLLSRENIQTQMDLLIEQLSGFDAIGQSDFIARDPLAFRNLVLTRLSGLLPVKGTTFQQGFPVSKDGRHVLVIATPKASGTDTANSREITALINTLSGELGNPDSKKGFHSELTAVGSYRAALDNETIIKKDTQTAILFATIGIALLLLLSFPRPYIGLLSLVPAFVGTILSFFVCSLVHESLSILALGFGGAIISITVDHSIAYLLFLDRPQEVNVQQSAHEIRSIGFMAVITTVGAFLVLTFSGFKILAQIGQFAAMGIAFSFLFVHTIFPRIIPVIAPAKKTRTPLLQKVINTSSKPTQTIPFFIAVALLIVMAFLAKPDFNVNLQQMNTVSPETLAAELKIKETWGDVFKRVFVLVEADSLRELQDKSDQLTILLEQQSGKGQLEKTFTPGSVFPGADRARKNHEAWRNFWTEKRIQQLKQNLQESSSVYGFADDAFEPFFEKLGASFKTDQTIPDPYLEMMGISRDPVSEKWRLFVSLTPGASFNIHSFQQEIAQDPSIKLFDADLFSENFGQLLSSTFLKMLGMIAIAVVSLIFIFFLDWKLTLISLLPIAFALICTLGTLSLLHHPLDIPGLMLAIIVAGMGIDYSLFLVRSYQRYGDEAHQFHKLIRTAILLAAISTMIGFGILVTADHYLLYSAGLVSLLGIGYSLFGAYALLPPILRRLANSRKIDENYKPKGSTRFKRVLHRYSGVEAVHRMFARFKLIMDPLFQELDSFLDNPSLIIDIGCGIGVPSSWILDRWPETRIYALDPDMERVRVASRVLGPNCRVEQGAAPVVPDPPALADTAVLLDMLHYLDNKELYQTLENLYQRLKEGSRLIIRVTTPLKERTPWFRWVESRQIQLRGARYYYRSLDEITRIMENAGYLDIKSKPSGKGREETWITARTRFPG